MRLPSVGSSQDRLLVLGYHNIESTWRWPAPAGSGVKSFTRQLRILRRTTNVVPLDWALQMLQAGDPLPPRAVAITFDDGYRDNLTVAVPLLNRLRIPATVFLVPGFLSGEVHAWWERLGWAVRHARVSSIDFDGKRFGLSGERERTLALDGIEESLKRRDHAARQFAVESLVHELDPEGSYRADELFMDWDGARGLVRAGISIGSHTMRHAILARETVQSQRDDLRESRRVLQDALDTPVETLAYPNGCRDDYDATTIAALRDAGYSHAVTTWGCTASAETPPFEVCRRIVSPDRPAPRLAASVLRDLLGGHDRAA